MKIDAEKMNISKSRISMIKLELEELSRILSNK